MPVLPLQVDKDTYIIESAERVPKPPRTPYMHCCGCTESSRAAGSKQQHSPGRFDQRGLTRRNQSLGLGVVNHILADPVLDRTARTERFEFPVELRVGRCEPFEQRGQIQQGRVPTRSLGRDATCMVLLLLLMMIVWICCAVELKETTAAVSMPKTRCCQDPKTQKIFDLCVPQVSKLLGLTLSGHVTRLNNAKKDRGMAGIEYLRTMVRSFQ
jgi:hypothetical protein